MSRERIVRAAVELVERDGPEALSMRRIAAEVDAGVMSLYNHVHSKDALLDAMAEHILQGLELGADPAADWPDQVRTLMGHLRAIGARYPRSVMLVVTRLPGTAAGWRPIEQVLATARGAGFAGREAVCLVRTFLSFSLGCLVHEASRSAHGAVHPAGDLPECFVHVRDLLPELTDYDADLEFEFGLEMLISAMAARQPAGT